VPVYVPARSGFALERALPKRYSENMEEGQAVVLEIEFNPSAFKHGCTEADIRWAFDTEKYDGWFKDGDTRVEDQYMLIGFDVKGNPIEILYNIIDDRTINVFHAMKCRSIYRHLIRKEE
jgi:hypothetical protein